jgi:hypothetical protein
MSCLKELARKNKSCDSFVNPVRASHKLKFDQLGDI